MQEGENVIANNYFNISGLLTGGCTFLLYVGLDSKGVDTVNLLCNTFYCRPVQGSSCDKAKHLDIYVSYPDPPNQFDTTSLTLKGPTNAGFGNSFTPVDSTIDNLSYGHIVRNIWIDEILGSTGGWDSLNYHHDNSSTDLPPLSNSSAASNRPPVVINIVSSGTKQCPILDCYYRGKLACTGGGGGGGGEEEGGGGGYPWQGGSPPAPDGNEGGGLVYPNPTTGLINFNLQTMYPEKPYDEVLNGTLHLYNANLEQVYTSAFAQSNLIQRELSGIAAGTYTYQISTTRGMKTGTIILVR